MSSSERGADRGTGRPRPSGKPLLPTHFQDPLGLAGRIVRSRNASAYYAAASSVAAACLGPLDRLLEAGELRAYERAPDPRLPVLLVAGPPRSGTTLLFQCLVRAFDVSYPTNLVAMFPRSPIRAGQLRRDPFRNRDVELASYYGRTRHWYGTSDALHLWDRWLDPDRRRVTAAIPPEHGTAMRRFFGAWEAAFARPLVMKNNSLNTCAALVGAELEPSVFLILERDPFFLAQALLLARSEIQGAPDRVYGVDDPSRPRGADPVEDVALQVAFYRRSAEAQLTRLSSDRCRIVSYEAFCDRPMELLSALGERLGYGEPLRAVPPLRASARVRLDQATAARLGAALKSVGVAA